MTERGENKRMFCLMCFFSLVLFRKTNNSEKISKGKEFKLSHFK